MLCMGKAMRVTVPGHGGRAIDGIHAIALWDEAHCVPEIPVCVQ